MSGYFANLLNYFVRFSDKWVLQDKQQEEDDTLLKTVMATLEDKVVNTA